MVATSSATGQLMHVHRCTKLSLLSPTSIGSDLAHSRAKKSRRLPFQIDIGEGHRQQAAHRFSNHDDVTARKCPPEPQPMSYNNYCPTTTCPTTTTTTKATKLPSILQIVILQFFIFILQIFISLLKIKEGFFCLTRCCILLAFLGSAAREAV